MSLTRRDFLRAQGSLLVALGAAGLTAGCAASTLQSTATPSLFRPPGAVNEAEFLTRCIRCSKCSQSCPTDAITLTGWREGLKAYMPYMSDLRKRPCNLCMACTNSCPTGALQPIAYDDQEAILAKVKIAKVTIDQKVCPSWVSNRFQCRICYDVCPLKDKAIRLDENERPYIVPEGCVGCGLCAKACPTDVLPIRISRREA